MSQGIESNIPQESLEKTDELVRELKQLAMGLEKNNETSERSDNLLSEKSNPQPQDWTSNLGSYNPTSFSQPQSENRSDKQVSDSEHKALIEKIKSEYRKPPLNPNLTLPSVTSPNTLSSTNSTYQPTTNITSFSKDLDNLHSKVDEILRRTPVAQKRDKEANELYSSSIQPLAEGRRNSASSNASSQVFPITFNPSSNLAAALAQPKTETQPKDNYVPLSNYGEVSSSFATPVKSDPQSNYFIPPRDPNQSQSIAQSQVFNNLPPTNTYQPLSTLNPTLSKLGNLPTTSTTNNNNISNSQFLGNSTYNPYSTYSNPYSNPTPVNNTNNYNPYSTYSYLPPTAPNSGSLPRDRTYTFDKDKLDQIINKIQNRGGNASLSQQAPQNTSNHGPERERSEKDMKNSQVGSEFGDWRRNNFRGEFQSDAPFPTFTEEYRTNLNNWAPQTNNLDKASPKFSFDPFDNRRIYTQHPQYEAKRGSHSERNDGPDSQPASKRDSIKPNANDFFRNLEQGKAVIKMVSKDKPSGRQEEYNYNCGELENDDDSLILGFLNTKLKSIAQEDPYFCGNLEEDDDDQKFTEQTVAGGSKKRNSRNEGNSKQQQGGLKESGIVDYEEFARGINKNDSRSKQEQRFLDDDDDQFVDFENDGRNRGTGAQRAVGHRRSDNMDSDKYLQKTEQRRK